MLDLIHIVIDYVIDYIVIETDSYYPFVSLIVVNVEILSTIFILFP